MKPHSGFISILLIIILALCGCKSVTADKLVNEQVRNNTIKYSVEDFINTTELQGSSFSPNGKMILVSSNAQGMDNAFAVNSDGEGELQLTKSKDKSIRVVEYFPDDERFLFLADEAGNEMDHIYVRELNGSYTDLTPGTDHLARFMGWSWDGRSFFIITNERTSRFFDIYEVNADDYKRRMIYQDVTGYEVAAISKNKRKIALIVTNRRDDTDILIYDVKTGITDNVTSRGGNAEYRFQSFSPDGLTILYTTNLGTEFSYLVSKDLVTGKETVVLQPNWDVTYAAYSHNGTYIVIGINNNAKTELVLLDGVTYKRIGLSSLPQGDITSVSFSRNERKMAFYASTSRTPPNLYVYDLVTHEIRQLTDSLNHKIDVNDLVDGESVSFTSFDGLKIPGILYKPHSASPANKVPALVWVHGGPGGQSRVKYHALIQYLVNHDYAVFAINNRGSSGYGKSFFIADDRRHGDADLDDCVASKDLLKKLDYIDQERIGIIGKSYGGYLSLAAVTFRPNEFAIAIDIFGITNWVRTLSNLPAWWEHLREALYIEIGHPERDREYLQNISPLYHADKIVKPIMVLQGANDPRVLKEESDDIVKAVRGNGIPVNYLLFQDEGHELRKKENRRLAYRSILGFLDRYLKESSQ